MFKKSVCLNSKLSQNTEQHVWLSVLKYKLSLEI